MRTIAKLSLFCAVLVTNSAACRCEETPGEALIRLGARTGPSALAVWPNYTQEAKKYQAENPYSYVVIGMGWTGGVEGLKYLKALPNLRGVMFTNPAFGDDWCECLRGRTGLKELFVSGDRFTDKGASVLKDLVELEALSLCETSISDEGMRNLKGMCHLRWLSLALAQAVTDQGFANVPVKELRFLNLEYSSVSGRSMYRLKEATNLEWLRGCNQLYLVFNFFGFKIDEYPVDAGLKHLVKLKKLKTLSIGAMTAKEEEMNELLANSTELPYIQFDLFIFTREGSKPREAADKTLEKMLKRLKDQAHDAAKK